MRLLKTSEIKTGNIYTVRQPDDKAPYFTDMKELVLAQNKKDLICLILDFTPTDEERKVFAKLSFNDFIKNEHELIQKYEEQMVMHEKRGKEIISFEGDILKYLE